MTSVRLTVRDLECIAEYTGRPSSLLIGQVSVFFRCVEYYKGVLFLITNRVGRFDDAFTSRSHVIIHYPPLSKEVRRAIWEGFFGKLKKERPEIKVSRRTKNYVLGDPEMTNVELNGREIRNGKS